MFKSRKIFFSISMVIYCILLIVSYQQISEKFDYYDIVMGKKFKIEILILQIILVCVLAGFFLLKKEISQILYSLNCIIFLIPAGVGYLFNPFISEFQIFSYIAFSSVSLLVFKLSENLKNPKRIFLSNRRKLFFALLCIFFVLLFYDRMNVGNIFKEVYSVRLSADYSGTKLEAFFFAFIVRFLVPFLAIIALRRQNYLLFFFTIIVVILSYTIGNVKSVLFGFFISIIFAFTTTHAQGFKNLHLFFICLISIGIVEDYFFKTYIVHDYFVRRVILFPPVIASYFFDFFSHNYLEFSRLIGGESVIPAGYSVSMFIGEFHMPYFTDPSSGVIVQGFVNFGLLGVVLISFLWASFIAILIVCNISPCFIGLIIYLFYLSNTAFLTTLLFTHGMFFGLFLLAYLKVER